MQLFVISLTMAYIIGKRKTADLFLNTPTAMKWTFKAGTITESINCVNYNIPVLLKKQERNMRLIALRFCCIHVNNLEYTNYLPIKPFESYL